ncbi:proton-conducting transporter membrane subunit [Cyanobium sp. Morenito 9A2]|uniref:proton-conducting transporter transmembrane domain-containing protein n=1 Tax=Cyanobium sp. Morenito 9A2 TaxID=2823718 RepID=UPI0020CD40B2|nr:proton-conducting transporter membrane subunit [Cyanobium sp. Morenito 9A2]MCP9848896.1 proton-conducting membrane transporter [Cyanobium sp. Morenito 9A2]
MIAAAIAWLLVPFLAAFITALAPHQGRPLTLLTSAATVAMAAAISAGWVPESLPLLGPLGVVLQPDALAAPFLLVNGLVVAAVVLDGADPGGDPTGGPSPEPPKGRLPLLALVLLGALNSAVVAVDLISIYVALELVGVAVMLLLALGNDERDLWLALRYGLLSNTVMLLFLIGAGLVYLQQGTFALGAAPLAGGVPLALLVGALVSKGELFLAGLWLPRTNAQAPLAVSALLSGAVVSAGVAPLLRLAALTPPLVPVLQGLGVLCAGLGVVFALAETDLRRLLAWSTLSQMGLVVLWPATGALLALAHGLAKAALFLSARGVPSPDLRAWRQRPLAAATAVPLLLASGSIAGVPPLLGFAAKGALEKGALGPLEPWVALVGVGTVAVYARLWGAPVLGLGTPKEGEADPTAGMGSWSLGALLLAAALLLLNLCPWVRPAWDALANDGLGWPLLKTGATVAAGVGLERWLETRRRPWGLPSLEGLDDLLAALVLLAAALVLGLSR